MFKAALLLLSAGLGVVTVWHWQLWAELPVILARDTLWHLSLGARVILVALSTCAVMATALCCLVKSMQFERFVNRASVLSPGRWLRGLLLDLASTIALLWVAVSVAPQVFYVLYVAVIPGLPMQWVASPVNSHTLLEFLRLTPGDSMATLIVGIMLHSILAASIIFWLSVPTRFLNAKW